MSNETKIVLRAEATGTAQIEELARAMSNYANAEAKVIKATTDLVAQDGKVVEVVKEATLSLGNQRTAIIAADTAYKGYSVSITQNIAKLKEQAAAVKAAEKLATKQKETQKELNYLAGYYRGENTKTIKSIQTATDFEISNAKRRANILANTIRDSKLSVDSIKKIWADLSSGTMGNYDKQQQKIADNMKAMLDAQKKLGLSAIKDQEYLDKFNAARRSLSQKQQLEQYQYIAGRRLAIEKATLKLQEIQQSIADKKMLTKSQQLSDAMAKSRVERLRNSLDPKLATNIDAASNKELASFAKQQTALREFLAANRYTGAQIRQVWDDTLKAPKTYGNNLDLLRNKMQPVIEAHKNLGAEVSKANANAKGLFISLNSAARLVGVQVAHQAISSLVRGLQDSIGYAIDLQIKIAEIQTLDNKQLDFSQWRNEIMSISNAYGLDALDQAKAAYETLSNQIAEGADSFRFLEQSAQFAVTTVSTSGEAVDLLSSAINAYGMSVNDTHKIAASFFKTIDLGRVTASEMANTFGRLAVPARMAGISLEELQAAITVTTRQGVKYSESATLIRNVILKLINPTEEMTKLMRSMGYETGEAWVKAVGFGQVLQKIEEYAQGSSTEIHDLFNTIRATVGAMVFAGDGVKQFNKDLGELQASVGTYDSKLGIIMDNSGKRVQTFHNHLRNIMRDMADFVVEFEAASLKVADYLSGFDITLVKEKDLQDNISLMRKYSESITNKQSEILNNSYRLLNNNLTLERKVIFEKQDIVLEGLKKQKELIDKSNDDELVNLREKLSEERKILNDHKKNVIDTYKDIRDRKIDLDKKIMDSKFSTSDEGEKMKILKQAIKDIKLEVQKSFNAGDLETFEIKSKELTDTIFKYKEVLDAVEKKNIQVFEKRRGTSDIQFNNELFRQTERKHKQDVKDIENELRKAKTTSERAEVLKKAAAIEKEYEAQKRINLAVENKIKPEVELKKAGDLYNYGRRQLGILEQQRLEQSRLNIEKQKAVISIAEHEAKNLPTAEDIKKVTAEAVGPKDWGATTKALKTIEEYINKVKKAYENSKYVENRKNLQDFISLLELNKVSMENNVALAIKQNALDTEKGNIAKKNAKEQEEYNKKIADYESSQSRLREMVKPLNRSTFLYTQDSVISNRLNDFLNFPNMDKYTRLIKDVTSMSKTAKTLPILGGADSSYYKELLSLLEKVKPGTREAQQADLQKKNKSLVDLEQQSKDSIAVGNQLYANRNQYIERQIELLKQRNSLEANKGTGGNLLNSLYGMFGIQQKASGGFIRDTMDNIPAMLSAGEFVINAKSTRKFFNQLQAINAPQPRGYASGGMVTTVGDVNISMQPSGNTQADVIAIGKALRREIRRGTISLG